MLAHIEHLCQPLIYVYVGYRMMADRQCWSTLSCSQLRCHSHTLPILAMIYPIDTTSYVSPNHSTRVLPPAVFGLHSTVGGEISSLKHLCNPRPINPQTGLPDPLRAVSCHYLINKVGKIYQLVQENRVAWHAGPGQWQQWTNINAVSIGVELVNRNDGKDPYPKAQIDALTWLAVQVIKRHKIAITNVIRHCDWAPGRKTDPKGFPWEQWKARLQMELDKENIPETSPTNNDPRWGGWGTQIPLYENQKTWGIPQAWLKASKKLGEARSGEIYPGTFVVQVFEHGVILYSGGKAETYYESDIGVKK